MFNKQSSEKKNIKLTDKSFLRLFVTSILAIAICIICLCSSTWAWFTQSISGASNELKVADACLISISVVDENGTELTDLENGVDLVAGMRYTVTISLPKDSASGYYVIKTLGTSGNEVEISTETEPDSSTEAETETDGILETESETDSQIETALTTEFETESETEIKTESESAVGFNLRVASEPGAEKVYYTNYIARHNDDETKTVTFALISARNQRVTISSCWGIYSGDCDVDENGILNID